MVRDAIDLYAADHAGQLPGADNQEAPFKANLEPYLRKFPENPTGVNPRKRDQVQIVSGGAEIMAAVDNDKGWIYHSGTGEFHANSDDVTSDGSDIYSGL